MSSLVSALFPGLTLGRVDQGLDFGGSGPVRAIGSGRVISSSIWPGWPGTGGVVYESGGKKYYVMEDFAPSVRAGQQIKAGQILGRATGGSTGIEAGYANTAGTGPIDPYNGRPDGTETAGGKAFKAQLVAGPSTAEAISELQEKSYTEQGVNALRAGASHTAEELLNDLIGWVKPVFLKGLLYTVFILGGIALAGYGLATMLKPEPPSITGGIKKVGKAAELAAEAAAA